MNTVSRLLSMALIAASVIAVSCSSSDSPSDPNTSSGETFTFTKSGGLTGNSNYSSYTLASFSTENDATYILGSDAVITTGPTANMVVITVPGKTTGTYTLGDSECTLTMFANSVPYIATSGTVVVSSFGAVGSQIKGTFSGTLISATGGAGVTITNGVFDVKRDADDLYND